MVIAPLSESSSFGNRNKFDLVVLYDQNSTSYEPLSPLSILQSAIAEREFKKALRRMPMLLVGGLDAWKKDMGAKEVVGEAMVNGVGVNGSESFSPPPIAPSTSGSMASPPLKTKNPFAAGGAYASTSPIISASSSSSSTTEQYWTPRSRADTTTGVVSPSNGKEHRSNQSLDYGHSRSPAESSHAPGGLTRRPGIRGAISSSSLTQTIAENVSI